MTNRREDGEKRTVNGIDYYWSRRLQRWVTIPDRDDDPPMTTQPKGVS